MSAIGIGQDGPMQLTVVDHPLARVALTVLRDETTDVAGFRHGMGTLSSILAYEAVRGLPVTDVLITTPLTETVGARFDALPLVVPVLRAGLGLLPGMLEHLPGAPTAFVGVKRNEATLVPEPYLDTVPDRIDAAEAFVLDPMLATGGSLNHAAELLRRRGAERVTAVCVLAAPEGIAALRREGAVDHLVVASIDDYLDDDAFIVPGLGDAGDRLYGVA